ncbi:hypothetical protein GGH12_002296 [Coemansia sp. RSA 1822]|nr:hypothetical protein LPJ76_000278 [Coemansia sp. RSA 638]KAJ2124508.1 hypothetical protein IW147_001677 [Coemansia sp. RSA 720]KAJ2544531.1 hypothetical protein GGF49_001155 [Coemansia sp. RSA 1853]KAJ2563892.1 hypothetical protein GGH12_002296 [Coemansia sp. RSA 1822]
MRFSTSLALLAATAASASAADTCSQKGQHMCGEENTSLLLECDGSSWATITCGAGMYCMTMNSAMIHCMLEPDGGDDETTQATATESELGSESDDASESDAASGDDTKSDTSSASSVVIRSAAAMAFAAVGLAALF